MLRPRRQGSGLGAALVLMAEVIGEATDFNMKKAAMPKTTCGLTSRGPVPSGKAGCEANLAQGVLFLFIYLYFLIFLIFNFFIV